MINNRNYYTPEPNKCKPNRWFQRGLFRLLLLVPFGFPALASISPPPQAEWECVLRETYTKECYIWYHIPTDTYYNRQGQVVPSPFEKQLQTLTNR